MLVLGSSSLCQAKFVADVSVLYLARILLHKKLTSYSKKKIENSQCFFNDEHS